MRRKIQVVVLAIVIAVTVAAQAAGPFSKHYAAGTTPITAMVADLASSGRPQYVDVFFPDQEVTVSYWDYTAATGWVRLNNSGAFATCDSVATIPAGMLIRSDFRTRLVYITRSASTSGSVQWYQ